jgi:hypothetical protein
MNTVLKAESYSTLINQKKTIQMLEVKDGKIFVEGVETIDPELIGFAFLDIIEQNPKSAIIISTDKNLISIINNQTELVQISEFAQRELYGTETKLPFTPHFACNWTSTHILYNFLMMIRRKDLVFTNKN